MIANSKYHAALIDPFSVQAEGAQIPDYYSFPTVTETIRQAFMLTPSSTSGTEIDFVVLPQLLQGLVCSKGVTIKGPGTVSATNFNYVDFTNSIVAGNNTATTLDQFQMANITGGSFTPSQLQSALATYRIVGYGVKIYNRTPMQYTQGEIFMAEFPVNNVATPQVAAVQTKYSELLLSYGGPGIDDVGSFGYVSTNIFLLPGAKSCASVDILDGLAWSGKVISSDCEAWRSPINLCYQGNNLNGTTTVGYQFFGLTSTAQSTASTAAAGGELVSGTVGTIDVITGVTGSGFSTTLNGGTPVPFVAVNNVYSVSDFTSVSLVSHVTPYSVSQICGSTDQTARTSLFLNPHAVSGVSLVGCDFNPTVKNFLTVGDESSLVSVLCGNLDGTSSTSCAYGTNVVSFACPFLAGYGGNNPLNPGTLSNPSVISIVTSAPFDKGLLFFRNDADLFIVGDVMTDIAKYCPKQCVANPLETLVCVATSYGGVVGGLFRTQSALDGGYADDFDQPPPQGWTCSGTGLLYTERTSPGVIEGRLVFGADTAEYADALAQCALITVGSTTAGQFITTNTFLSVNISGQNVDFIPEAAADYFLMPNYNQVIATYDTYNGDQIATYVVVFSQSIQDDFVGISFPANFNGYNTSFEVEVLRPITYDAGAGNSSSLISGSSVAPFDVSDIPSGLVKRSFDEFNNTYNSNTLNTVVSSVVVQNALFNLPVPASVGLPLPNLNFEITTIPYPSGAYATGSYTATPQYCASGGFSGLAFRWTGGQTVYSPQIEVEICYLLEGSPNTSTPLGASGSLSMMRPAARKPPCNRMMMDDAIDFASSLPTWKRCNILN